ncbi:MAG: VIT and vWA domain-containing protein [Opitutales bacterium]
MLTVHGGQDVQLQDHRVEVSIEGGYARTTATQTFHNPGTVDLEAVYTVPLPEEATLAAVRVQVGDTVLHGEVVPRSEAERIYEDEASAGRDAAKAVQDGFRRYAFQIARLPAGEATVLEVVYYQPVVVDTGVGTYRYRLETGGTDEAASAFWHGNDRLEGTFSVTVAVEAGAPLRALRAPGYENGATALLGPSAQTFSWQGPLARLNRDFVLYYQLEEDLPGRVEVYAHKPDAASAGTFLAVITPGLDLQPLEGSDTVFVLDLSGSMQHKFGTLVQGVREALKAFSPRDRYRIVLFSDEAEEWTRGWVEATPENVARTLAELERLEVRGGTNLYAGIEEGLARLDADRACSFVLVTDAVANQGIVDEAAFRRLLARYDVRFFGFLLGNEANDPLMQALAEATGGYARALSNAQDIVGEILLAQGKVAYQSLHDARFTFGGSAVPFDLTGQRPGKLFRGQQILVFGRYREGGELTLRLDARLTGENKTYATRLTLPAVEPSRPELERLWALRQLREWEDASEVPGLDAGELDQARLDLALEYQLVTEETSMLLLTDAQFAAHGLERRNQARLGREEAARALPPPPARTDAAQPLTGGRAPTIGGGALGGSWLFLFGAVVVVSIFFRRSK